LSSIKSRRGRCDGGGSGVGAGDLQGEGVQDQGESTHRAAETLPSVLLLGGGCSRPTPYHSVL
jgi:hypothetical protein